MAGFSFDHLGHAALGGLLLEGRRRITGGEMLLEEVCRRCTGRLGDRRALDGSCSSHLVPEQKKSDPPAPPALALHCSGGAALSARD